MKLKKTVNQSNKQHHLSWILAGGLVVIALALGAYFVSKHYNDGRMSSTNGLTVEQKQQEQKQNQQKKEETANRDSGSKNSTPAGAPQGASVFINRGEQTQRGGPVSIRATVIGVTTGTCIATFTNSARQTFVREFPIKFEATSASCNTDTPADTFPSSGMWSLKLVAKSGSSSSAEATASITVER